MGELLTVQDMLNRVYDSISKAIDVKVTGSNATLIIEALSQAVVKGEVLIVSGDATNYVGKTAYVYATADGYVALEAEIDGVWYQVVPSQTKVLEDVFTGVDGSALSSAWEITKATNYTVNTWGKIYGNKMRLNVEASVGFAQAQALVNIPLYLSSEYVIEFDVDETIFSDATTEMKVGLVPTKPADSQDVSGLAGAEILAWFYAGAVHRGATTYNVAVADTTQSYRVVVSATSVKVYRGTEKIIDQADILDQSQYYFYIQLITTATAGLRTHNSDDVNIYARLASSKVNANNLWVKTITDVIPGNLRVVFQNDLDNDNVVTIRLCGQP